MSENSVNDSFEDSLLGFEEPFNEDNDIFDKVFALDFDDESVLIELSTNEDLPQIVLSFDRFLNSKERKEFYFEYVFGLTNLLYKLSQIEDPIIDLWIRSPKQTDNCILTTIFRFIPNCYLDLCLPKFIDLSKYDKNIKISFYEYICFNVCNLLTTFTSNHFEIVEQILFDNLLSEQSVCQLLASDVLCFMARLSKSALCYHFCSILMTIANTDDSYLPKSASLLNRLIPFLQVLEFEYLLKDYDIISHSKVWSVLNVSRVLSNQQIVDTFNRFEAIIADGKALSKYDLNILRDLFKTEALDEKTRENTFDLFLRYFLDSKQSIFDSNFIDLLTVLIPKQLNDSNVYNITQKVKQIVKQNKSNNLLIEKLLTFFTRLSNVKIPIMNENRLTGTISSSIKQIHKNNNFYVKYLLFKALTDISTKSKYINITTDCCEEQQFKRQFLSYVIKLKSKEVMNKNEKIDYLHKNIVLRLQTESDFKSKELIEEKAKTNNQLMSKKRKRIAEEEDKPIDNQMESKVESMIEGLERNVKELKKNQLIVGSIRYKRRLLSAFDEFKRFVHSLEDIEF